MMSKSLFWAVVALCAMGLISSRVRAGGSCINAADCNDNNDCTNDACVNSNCQHNPVLANTPCGDPSDTVCTNPDRCSAAGVCLRNDAPNGTGCFDTNLCIVGESCDNGFCVGTRATNCCTTSADCNDHNACTNDSCAGNVCTHTNAAPGTPCGSSVDDNCSNPDTCNASGQCQTNDASDGQDCGGPDCLGGQCGPTTYRATMLPEGNNIGSETRGLYEDYISDNWFIVGRVIDGNSTDHAAAWKCHSSGGNCTLTLLPEGVAGTSVANAVACDGSGACLAVGSRGSPAQPAAWLYNGVSWTAESVPLPPTHTGGTQDTYLYLLDSVSDSPASAAGSSTDVQGFRRATYWERDAQGAWSAHVLPDFGGPGRDSAATDIDVCPTGAPAQLCVEGERLIAGWAENGSGVVHPEVWRETAPDSGTFTMTVLPLPVGAVRMLESGSPECLTCASRIWFRGLGASGGIFLSGTVALADGTTRGAVWKTENFQSWTSTVLSPLPGFANSRESGSDPNNDTLTYAWEEFDLSYPTGGDPMLDGVATKWTLDPDTLALTSGPTDMNAVFTGLPTDYHVGSISKSKGGDGPLYGTLMPQRRGSYKLEMSDVGPSAVAGTPQPHAVIVIAGPPAGIPAVSAWGLALLTLLTLIAATLVLANRGRVPQPRPSPGAS